MKHKVLQDYPHITPQKSIVTIKKNSILVDYTTNDGLLIDSEVVNNNPEFFSEIDWKQELSLHLKANKIKPVITISKVVESFIQEQFIDGVVSITINDFESLKSKTSVKEILKVLNKYNG